MILIIWMIHSLLSVPLEVRGENFNSTGKALNDKQRLCRDRIYSGVHSKCFDETDLTHLVPLLKMIYFTDGPSPLANGIDSHRHHCFLELAGFSSEDPGWSCQSSFIRINGEKLDMASFILNSFTKIKCRGVHLITLDFQNNVCSVGMNMSFDTYGSEMAAAALDAQLMAFPAGTVIAAVTDDEFTYRLGPAAITLELQYGVRLKGAIFHSSQWYRSSAVFVAVKGDHARAHVTQLPRKLGPAKTKVDLVAENNVKL